MDSGTNNERDRLIKKCNLQLDYINQQTAMIEEKDRIIEQLRKDISNNNMQADSVEANINNNFLIFFVVFYDVISKTIKNNNFFEIKRVTENSKKYSVIDYKLLSDYIEGFNTNYTAKKIVEVWGMFGLVYLDENDSPFVNFTFEKKSIRSVRISKAAVNMVKECMFND